MTEDRCKLDFIREKANGACVFKTGCGKIWGLDIHPYSDKISFCPWCGKQIYIKCDFCDEEAHMECDCCEKSICEKCGTVNSTKHFNECMCPNCKKDN